jgi:hypothetical protein
MKFPPFFSLLHFSTTGLPEALEEAMRRRQRGGG